MATTADMGERKRRHDGTDDPSSGVSEGRGRGVAARVAVEEDWHRAEVEQHKLLVLLVRLPGP